MAIRAIETRYAGCRFRSRLEARWAVFFDALGASWDYEPEGFELPSGRYLPDFRIRMGHPTGPTWFEVKPAPEGNRQPEIDARWSELHEVTGLTVLVAFGMHRSGDTCNAQYDRASEKSYTLYDLSGDYEPPESFLPKWTPHTRLTLYRGKELWEAPNPWGNQYFPGVQYLTPEMWNADVEGAYAAASSARFEFGESG